MALFGPKSAEVGRISAMKQPNRNKDMSALPDNGCINKNHTRCHPVRDLYRPAYPATKANATRAELS